MIGDIEKLIGCKVSMQAWEPLKLPNYIAYERKFHMLDAEGTSFIVVELNSEDKADIRSLKSQVKKISAVAGCPVVLCLSSIRKIQMDALVRNRIPFIVPDEQVYVPFLGVALRYKNKGDDIVKKDKFIPSAQMLFLMMLYRNDSVGILKKDAADFLGITRTSVTRASEQLANFGLIREDRNGREVLMTPVDKGYQYYIKAKEHLDSPIQKNVFVKRSNGLNFCCTSGETALSKYSFLNAPRIPSYACDKKNAANFDGRQVDPKWQSDYDIVKIELWKYEPSIFANKGMVDPVSLACSFLGNTDERIEKEIEVMLENYKW